jgi:hypothetical protein
MAKRDEMLNNFLQNPLAVELCDCTAEELSQVSFSMSSNDYVIDSLKRMIISAIERDETATSTISAVNKVLKS